MGELITLVKGMSAQLQDMGGRLSKLENTVDQRFKETRPIWEQVLSQLDQIEVRLGKIERNISLLVQDTLNALGPSILRRPR